MSSCSLKLEGLLCNGGFVYGHQLSATLSLHFTNKCKKWHFLICHPLEKSCTRKQDVLCLRLNIHVVINPANTRTLTLLGKICQKSEWLSIDSRESELQTCNIFFFLSHLNDENITTCVGDEQIKTRGNDSHVKRRVTLERIKATDCWVSGTVKEVSVEGWLVQVTVWQTRVVLPPGCISLDFFFPSEGGLRMMAEAFCRIQPPALNEGVSVLRAGL